VREIEPYVIHAHRTLQPLAATTAAKFSAHVVPEWNNHIVPQYYTYIAPHIQSALAYLDPYLVVVGTEYERYLAPYLRVSATTAWKLQERAQPYVILAWYKSVDGYRYAKPHARPAWERFKDVVLRIFAYLAVYRRQFVDPHVAQMWAKIKELSGDKAVSSTTKLAVTPEPVPVAETPVKVEPSTVAAIFVEEDTHPPAPVSTPIPPAVLTNDEMLSSEATVPMPTEPEVVPPQEAEPQTFVAATPIMPPADETPIPTPTRAPNQAMPIPPVTSEDEDDLDLFSTEIGLDLDEPEDEPEDEEVLLAPPPEESDEEREARLKAKAEETAWKRKEITDRHTDWEYQLEDLKREQMKTFRLALYNARQNSAKLMKADSNIQRAMSEFAADGDKYLKGAEIYLKNLVKEKKKQDKSALWERVIQKVKGKFEKRLDDVDRKVGDWFNAVTKNEQRLIDLATTPVVEFSEKAQADLGLDYSWLDDVTAEDWVRYHDLMRCALISFRCLTFVADDSFDARCAVFSQ
jgi:hypothetical protein